MSKMVHITFNDILDDNAQTRLKLTDLEVKYQDIEQLVKSNSFSNDLPNFSSLPQQQQVVTASLETPVASALQVLHDARRVLGFSPITPQEFECLKNK